jgi:aminoglycoside 3-N-acetyltransferase
MVHASVKSIGWIVGGPDVIIQALLDVLDSSGTLMMYIGWEDSPYELASWPENVQQAYLEECPPFDPATSRACRSNHPEASCAAVGGKARWLTENHPLQYGYGSGSPLAKLCEAKGKVLLLGAPFDAITILHYAEYLAKVPNKRIVHYAIPLLCNGQRIWVEIEEFDTCGDVLPAVEEYFQRIPQEYLSQGRGCAGKVGEAQSYLFDAADSVKFAVKWLEAKYGEK